MKDESAELARTDGLQTSMHRGTGLPRMSRGTRKIANVMHVLQRRSVGKYAAFGRG